MFVVPVSTGTCSFIQLRFRLKAPKDGTTNTASQLSTYMLSLSGQVACFAMSFPVNWRQRNRPFWLHRQNHFPLRLSLLLE